VESDEDLWAKENSTWVTLDTDQVLNDEKDVDGRKTNQDRGSDLSRVSVNRVDGRDEAKEQKEGSNSSSNTEDKMEMTNNEVGVVIGEINGLVGKQETGETTENEAYDETSYDDVLEIAKAKLGETKAPRENLDSGWDSDNGGSSREINSRKIGHTDSEHVVSPNEVTNKTDGPNGKGHSWVRNGLSGGKLTQLLRNETESWKNDDVNFRMTEKPKEVLKGDRVRAINEVSEEGGNVSLALSENQSDSGTEDRESGDKQNRNNGDRPAD